MGNIVTMQCMQLVAAHVFVLFLVCVCVCAFVSVSYTIICYNGNGIIFVFTSTTTNYVCNCNSFFLSVAHLKLYTLAAVYSNINMERYILVCFCFVHFIIYLCGDFRYIRMSNFLSLYLSISLSISLFLCVCSNVSSCIVACFIVCGGNGLILFVAIIVAVAARICAHINCNCMQSGLLF